MSTGPLRAPSLLVLPCLALACGDDGRGTGSASASGTSTVGSPTGSTGGAHGTTTDEPTGGTQGASMSSTQPTGTSLDPSASGTSASTGATGDSGGDLPTCNDAPPPGFQGPFDAACAVEPSEGTFTPVIEWHKDTWAMGPGSKSSVTAPIVVQLSDDDGDGDIDTDDTPDVVLVTYNDPNAQTSCWLRAVSGDGKTELWSVQNAQFSRNQNVSAADIDGDGVVEILTKAKDQKVYAYEHDGALKWTSAALGAHTGLDSTVSVSDMNGDGAPELVTGRAVLDNQGVLLGAGTHGTGSGGGGSMSFAVDLDGDGEQEVVVGDAVYNLAGADLWFNAKGDGFPGIVDLELDGVPEIVVVNAGKVRVQRSTDGSVVWDVAIPGGLGGPPTVADFDGDGMPEVGIAGKSRYTVFDTDGAALWTAVTQDASSGITGSTVYDFEGDGVADVVYADEINLYVFSGNDGAVKLKLAEHNSGTRIEEPAIADVDGDGQVEIVFVSESYGGQFGPVNGVTVVGDANMSWRPGRKIWNQHAYHITNVADDGTIPKVAAQNWLTYNSFRSADLSLNDGLAAPDLVMLTPDSCESACTGVDQLGLWVQLGNAGAVPLTAGAEIQVYGTKMGVESLLKTVPFQDVLDPGEYAPAIVVDIDTTDLEQVRLVAVAKEVECKVDPDNELVLMPPFCSAPG